MDRLADLRTLVVGLGFAVAAFTGALPAAELEVSVEVGAGSSALSPARAAALAEWNSPMGRLTHFLNEQHGQLLRGGQPGATAPPVFRVKLQDGLPPQLVAAAVDGGIGRGGAVVVSEIPWPWDDDASRRSTPLSDQLTLLLSQRLRPSGDGGNEKTAPP